MNWDDARWKEIPGFPSYLVSNKGQIFNIHRNKLLKPYYNQHGVLAVRLFRHMDEGSRGFTRSIPALVRNLFPEESKVDKSIEPVTLKQQIATIREAIGQSTDGEYHIPGVRFSDRSPDVAMLHDLVSRLSFYFPEFVWQTADSLFPQNTGITIRWRRKSYSVAATTKQKEISDGNS